MSAEEWDESAAAETVKILLYSDDVDTREQVKLAVGRRLGGRGAEVEWTEVATGPGAVSAVEKGSFDLLVLDGETPKLGGMGLCRQLKNEIFECPPVLVLTGRVQDAWLASWSLADGVVSHPLDAVVVEEAVLSLLGRDGAVPPTPDPEGSVQPVQA